MDIGIIILIALVSVYVFGCLIYILKEIYHFARYDKFQNSSTFILVLFDSLFWPGDLINVFFCVSNGRSRSNALDNIEA